MLAMWLCCPCNENATADRKSTRLNSSHLVISYAVFCLKKKKHTCERKSPWNHECHRLLLINKAGDCGGGRGNLSRRAYTGQRHYFGRRTAPHDQNTGAS